MGALKSSHAQRQSTFGQPDCLLFWPSLTAAPSGRPVSFYHGCQIAGSYKFNKALFFVFVAAAALVFVAAAAAAACVARCEDGSSFVVGRKWQERFFCCWGRDKAHDTSRDKVKLKSFSFFSISFILFAADGRCQFKLIELRRRRNTSEHSVNVSSRFPSKRFRLALFVESRQHKTDGGRSSRPGHVRRHLNKRG